MIDFNELKEQDMIDRAKAGDPEANYKMSLWALDRATEEPEEERWNRLAAKCLVKSAQAGYAPAVQRMNELLKKSEAPKQEPEPVPEEEPEFDWSAEPETTSAPVHSAGSQPNALLQAVAFLGMAGKKLGAFLGSLPEKLRRPQAAAPENGETPAQSSGRHSAGGVSPAKFFDFSGWDDAQWKKMRIICTAICVVLAVLIALMIISGKKDKTEEGSQLPTAATAEPLEATPSPTPVPYPDEAMREEIAAADLDAFPEDSEYVAEATTATITTSGSGLNLRRGPSTNYSQIVYMSNGETLEVYAERDGWALVQYNGTTWGWCSIDYLTYG